MRYTIDQFLADTAVCRVHLAEWIGPRPLTWYDLAVCRIAEVLAN